VALLPLRSYDGAQFALITGICAFAFAVVLIVANHRTFFDWLLLGGTFGNPSPFVPSRFGRGAS
jgi:hypothetical protein